MLHKLGVIGALLSGGKKKDMLTTFQKYWNNPVGKPRTDSVPPTMQSQIPKSRDVTLFFLDMTLLQVSGHALFTSTPHVFLLNIFINKTERSIYFYWIHFLNKIVTCIYDIVCLKSTLELGIPLLMKCCKKNGAKNRLFN